MAPRHVLNDAMPAALSGWLEQWVAGKLSDPDDAAHYRTVRVFSPQENRRLLWTLLAEVAS